MAPKIAAIVGALIGAWVGYHYILGVFAYYGVNATDYWDETGEQITRVVVSLGCAAVGAVIAHFVTNFFRRFD